MVNHPHTKPCGCNAAPTIVNYCAPYPPWQQPMSPVYPPWPQPMSQSYMPWPTPQPWGLHGYPQYPPGVPNMGLPPAGPQWHYPSPWTPQAPHMGGPATMQGPPHPASFVQHPIYPPAPPCYPFSFQGPPPAPPMVNRPHPQQPCQTQPQPPRKPSTQAPSSTQTPAPDADPAPRRRQSYQSATNKEPKPSDGNWRKRPQNTSTSGSKAGVTNTGDSRHNQPRVNQEGPGATEGSTSSASSKSFLKQTSLTVPPDKSAEKDSHQGTSQ